MLCRLIFKAITGFFTLLSPCIFNNLLSNDLSPPYPPPPHPTHRLPSPLLLLLTHSASPSVFSAPAAKYPAASLRLQSPIRPHLAVSFQQPHIRRGMLATKKKKPCTHTCAPALASSRVNCINTRVRALATLFTVLPQTFSHSPLHFRRKTLGSGEGRQRWGNAEVGLSLLPAPLRSPLVSRGSYL